MKTNLCLIINPTSKENEVTEMEMIKMNKILKRATFGLLLIFAIFLIVFTFNHEILTGDKKPAPIDLQNMTVKTVVSSGVKYTPLEPNTLNSLGIAKPTFYGNEPRWSYTFYIFCFMLLCVFAMIEYCNAALRIERMQYLLALREERREKRNRNNGLDKSTSSFADQPNFKGEAK